MGQRTVVNFISEAQKKVNDSDFLNSKQCFILFVNEPGLMADTKIDGKHFALSQLK